LQGNFQLRDITLRQEGGNTIIENLGGTSFDDILSGDNGRNNLRGLYGEDQLSGHNGIDYITGGAKVTISLMVGRHRTTPSLRAAWMIMMSPGPARAMSRWHGRDAGWATARIR